jgi:hypothetical protein
MRKIGLRLRSASVYRWLSEFPSQEIAMLGKAQHRYFLVLYAYFFSGQGVDIKLIGCNGSIDTL